MRPIKQGPNIGAILMILILLGGAGFGAYWWFVMRPNSPAGVVGAFTEATQSGDLEKMKDCLAASNRAFLDMPGVAEGFKKGFDMAKSLRGDAAAKKYDYGPTTFEGDSKAVVQVSEKKAEGETAGSDQSQSVVLVKEDGKWKIDLRETAMRELKKRGIELPAGMNPFGR
jgi:hypothetical protein